MRLFWVTAYLGVPKIVATLDEMATLPTVDIYAIGSLVQAIGDRLTDKVRCRVSIVKFGGTILQSL